jgi:hypothetical protein
MNQDTNSIVRAFLLDQSSITDLVARRVFVPRLPENTPLPAISLFTRGGTSDPYIPGLVTPSVQFDCWADDPLKARSVYRALYDVLQGIQRTTVEVDSVDYMIHSAIEEVQGQDIVDQDIQGYFRILTFFSFLIKAV